MAGNENPVEATTIVQNSVLLLVKQWCYEKNEKQMRKIGEKKFRKIGKKNETRKQKKTI
jgi:hypothetical protein